MALLYILVSCLEDVSVAHKFKMLKDGWTSGYMESVFSSLLMGKLLRLYSSQSLPTTVLSWMHDDKTFQKKLA